jgi:negative regulator of flagellin synthesis FlgM
MRVNQSGNNPVQNSEVSKVKVSHSPHYKKGEKTEEGSAASSSDVNADISSKGKELAKAKAAASQAPDVREEKIAALKAKIAEGKYKVDADAVADKLVDEHIKMAGIG